MSRWSVFDMNCINTHEQLGQYSPIEALPQICSCIYISNRARMRHDMPETQLATLSPC